MKPNRVNQCVQAKTAVNQMSLIKIFMLSVLIEGTIILARFVIEGQLIAKWSDIPLFIAVLFGVSPYGQLCYRWIKEKIK